MKNPLTQVSKSGIDKLKASCVRSPVSVKIKLSRPLPAVLGVGAYLKNAVCLIQGDEAWIGPDNGSLDCTQHIELFRRTVSDMMEAAVHEPVALAHDWHPDFYCSRWALESGKRTIGVQHHHAHIAAVMAEHGTEGPVLGLALDGFGLGANNEAWGGELLRVDAKGFERVGHLLPLHQPGGDVAARQPWRMGAAALQSLGRGSEVAERYADFAGADHLAMMMERGINAPTTSSAGRLFDAACGLLGVVPVAQFEGEAPMKLESMVTQSTVDPQGWRIENGVLDMRPLMSALLGMEVQAGANLFHGTLAAALTDWLKNAAQEAGLTQIALGGGCFFNKVLRSELERGMMAEGLTPLWPKQMSPGDPCIALGQAYAAALMIEADDRK